MAWFACISFSDDLTEIINTKIGVDQEYEHKGLRYSGHVCSLQILRTTSHRASCTSWNLNLDHPAKFTPPVAELPHESD